MSFVKLNFRLEVKESVPCLQDLLDSLCNSCSETLVYYRMVYTVDGFPSHSTPPKVVIVNDALERVSATLICCKVCVDFQLNIF